MIGTEIFQGCQRIWHTLPHNLKVMGYHSLDRLTNALDGTPIYKGIVWRLKINWIGLKLNLPLLFGLQEIIDQA